MKNAKVLLCATCLAASLLTDAAAGQEAPLGGTPEAVSLAEGILRAVGGRDVWNVARAIDVELVGYSAAHEHPWTERYSMDLEVPAGTFELTGEGTDRTIAWNPDGGWERDRTDVEALDQERIAFEIEYWRHQPVVLFHRLATGRPATRVTVGERESQLEIWDVASGERLARFNVNTSGEPILWASWSEAHQHDHVQVMGPLGDFGGVSLPVWGANADGFWRYEHTRVALRDTPPEVPSQPPMR